QGAAPRAGRSRRTRPRRGARRRGVGCSGAGRRACRPAPERRRPTALAAGGRDGVLHDLVGVEGDADAGGAGAAVTVPRGAVPLRVHAVDEELLLVAARVLPRELELAGGLALVRGVLRRVVRVREVHLDVGGELDHALAESDLLEGGAGVLLGGDVRAPVVELLGALLVEGVVDGEVAGDAPEGVHARLGGLERVADLDGDVALADVRVVSH